MIQKIIPIILFAEGKIYPLFETGKSHLSSAVRITVGI